MRSHVAVIKHQTSLTVCTEQHVNTSSSISKGHGDRNAFSEGSEKISLKFTQVLSFLKLDFNRGRFPTISDDVFILYYLLHSESITEVT